MVTVRLGSERERRLRKVAHTQGVPVAQVVRDAVDRHLGDVENGETLDVLLAGVFERVDLGQGNGDCTAPATDAERVFGEILDAMRRDGRV